MAATLGTQVQHDVWRLVQQINLAWLKGQQQELAGFFREDAVMVAPGFTARLEGRQACVASFKEFCEQATIRDFRESEPSVEVFADTAIASYTFEIAYEMRGQSIRERGRDLFVFVREDNRWQAAWRTLLSVEQIQ